MILETMGLGPHILSWISALYTSPSAQVKVNGRLSQRFPIRNGTRQGWLLSPLLVSLAREPFLRPDRANPNIKGVTVGTMEQKLSAYVDDILFQLTDPLILLPNLLRERQLFGLVSNFKINYNKSEVLPITLPSDH